MIDVPMNVNALSYYGTATTTSGSTAIGGATALPDFDKVENIVFNNESADFIAVKTGTSTVTVAFPTTGANASSMTIVGPCKSVSMLKEKSHTYFAVDSEAGSAKFSLQYGNGI